MVWRIVWGCWAVDGSGEKACNENSFSVNWISPEVDGGNGWFRALMENWAPAKRYENRQKVCIRSWVNTRAFIKLLLQSGVAGSRGTFIGTARYEASFRYIHISRMFLNWFYILFVPFSHFFISFSFYVFESICDLNTIFESIISLPLQTF